MCNNIMCFSISGEFFWCSDCFGCMLGLPVLIRMFFGGFLAVIVNSMPVFLIMTEMVNDIYHMRVLIWGINFCFAIICLLKGTIHYKTKQLA